MKNIRVMPGSRVTLDELANVLTFSIIGLFMLCITMCSAIVIIG